MPKIASRVITVVALWGMAVMPVFAAERIPNDPLFERQAYLRQIGVPDAWNDSLGFEGIIVAVIDSGVDTRHPDLKDNIWRNDGEIPGNGIDDDLNGYVDDVHGWDFVDGDNDPRPDATRDDARLETSHGTIAAGIIAARGDNGQGIVGVTWQTTIMPIRALDSSGEGDPLEVVRAIEYAVHNGAKIINMSFAGTVSDDVLRIAVRQAYDRGVFIVAAAGNTPKGDESGNLDRNPLYPICLDLGADENFIYGVAAVDASDRKASFSNYGAGCVDGSAPGVRFIGAQYYDPENSSFAEPYGGYFSGTSLAAPVVAGTAALMKAMNQKLTPKQITNMLTQTALNINDLNPEYSGKLGRGRIDAAKAVALAKGTLYNAPLPVASTQELLPPGSGSALIVAAPGPGRVPEARIFTVEGLFVRGFNAYPESFTGGVSLAIAKFFGSPRQTIVTGAGPGGGPQVRIFNINTQPIGGFLAYDAAFKGGIDVAVGDLDGDGSDEIVTGALAGGGPHVRVFTPRGDVIGGFFAFEQTFRGGIDVAAGDIDGDGVAEIIVASGRGRVTTVRVFKQDGTLLSESRPFGDKDTGGATVDVATHTSVARTDSVAFDAAASLVLAAPTVGAVGDATLTLTVPFALDADDTIVITFPAHMNVASVGAAVTGTFEATDSITCAAAGQVITCTTSAATNTTGTIIMTGITSLYASTDDIISVEVKDEGVGANDAAQIIVRSLVKGDIRFVDGGGAVRTEKPSAPYLLGAVKGAQPTVTSITANGTITGFAAYEPRFLGGVRAGVARME